LGVVDALPIRTAIHSKGPGVSNVAIDLTVAGVALDSGRTALAVEANGSAFALVVFLANLTVLFQVFHKKRGVDAKPTAAEAHDLDKPSLGPRHSICRLIVHALVVAGQTGVLKPGTAFEKATRLARRLYKRGAVLVVLDLVKGEAALLVRGVGAIWVGASGRNGALASAVDQGVAVEHVERLTLHSASHLETSSNGGRTLQV
jgi:hypothetical protein